jgi:hypothetical protein
MRRLAKPLDGFKLGHGFAHDPLDDPGADFKGAQCLGARAVVAAIAAHADAREIDDLTGDVDQFRGEAAGFACLLGLVVPTDGI